MTNHAVPVRQIARALYFTERERSDALHAAADHLDTLTRDLAEARATLDAVAAYVDHAEQGGAFCNTPEKIIGDLRDILRGGSHE